MMKCHTKRGLAVAIAAGMLCPLGAQATNGMFMIGYGAKSVAMGGAAIGFPQDALAGAVNPASVGSVGMRADVDAALFLPSAKACLGNLCEESRANTFLIPNMAGAMQFNRKLAFGFSAVGAGGGGSRYNQNLYNNATLTAGDPEIDKTLGVNLMVMQMNPTVAYKYNKNHSFGASMVISVQTFRAFGLDYFSNFTRTGLGTTTLTNRGNDWSYGAGLRAGWLGTFMQKRLTVGVAGTSKIDNSPFEKYSDLFAEAGDIDTPANFGVGAAYRFTDNLTVALDVQRVYYSGVNSISNLPPTHRSGVPVYPEDESLNRMGLTRGMGFGWEDQTIYKLGMAYQLNKYWTLRGGWNYGESPIPEDNGAILVNIVAPATTQHHLTLGGTYSLNDNIEVNFAYMHAYNFKQYGPTYIGGTGSIEMSQNSFGVGLGMKF